MVPGANFGVRFEKLVGMPVAVPGDAVARPGQNGVTHAGASLLPQHVPAYASRASVVRLDGLLGSALRGQVVAQHAEKADEEVPAHLKPGGAVPLRHARVFFIGRIDEAPGVRPRLEVLAETGEVAADAEVELLPFRIG